MMRPKRWQVRNIPRRFTSIVRSHIDMAISSAGVGSSDSPAATTRQSMRPAAAETVMTASSTFASSRTSTSTNSPDATWGTRRSRSNTRAPSARSRADTACPIPPAAPVTTTLAPVNPFMNFPLSCMGKDTSVTTGCQVTDIEILWKSCGPALRVGLKDHAGEIVPARFDHPWNEPVAEIDKSWHPTGGDVACSAGNVAAENDSFVGTAPGSLEQTAEDHRVWP